MVFRFRRSFKLAPGLRMNISGGGISWTIGPRGASVNIGKRGTFFNAGIPGTGLYSRERIGSRRRAERDDEIRPATVTVNCVIVVTDDGELHFKGKNGNVLPDEVIRTAKRQHGDTIRGLIQTHCDEVNAKAEALGNLHLATPSPQEKPCFHARQYDEPLPKKPEHKRLGLLGRLFKWQREKIEMENAEQLKRYEEELARWHAVHHTFVESERRLKDIIERGIYQDVTIMETFLEVALERIAWPRETMVSAEIHDGGKLVCIDLDLPEIEDMPRKVATPHPKALGLSMKDMPMTKLQRLYLRHVHSIGLRIIGEAFAALPTSEEVILSAYSQRQNRSNGLIGDEYLYSVRVHRTVWAQLDFQNLNNLDVVDVLGQFDMRRAMTKSGALKAIDPFRPNRREEPAGESETRVGTGP